jgi:hypothetical protein
MNEREQFELESYLREFQPRAPRALLPISQSQSWRRLAAAIAVLFLGSASIWSALHHTEHKTVVVREFAAEAPVAASTISLTKLALENPGKFEATLDVQALKFLQKFDQSDSALRVLAKD